MIEKDPVFVPVESWLAAAQVNNDDDDDYCDQDDDYDRDDVYEYGQII